MTPFLICGNFFGVVANAVSWPTANAGSPTIALLAPRPTENFT